MSESDESLVAKSRRGDRAAFEELVRRTARLVYARAYLETGDPHRAEDLTQETYLIAWRSIRQVTDAGGFRSWLTTITHTAAIDAGRRESRRKRAGKHESPEAMLRVADESATPLDSSDRKEQRENALAAVRQLPEEYRQVVMLRYLGGADYETISRQLALSNGSLRGLLHRGMELLRSRLSEKTS